MRRITTFVTVALLSLGASAVAEAQQPQGAPAGAAGGRRMAPMAMVDRMLDSMALTTEQTAAVDALKKKYEPQMLELREQMMAARQSGADMSAFRAQNQELNGKVEAELRAILTKDQVTLLEKNKAAAEARQREMMQRGGGNRPPRD